MPRQILATFRTDAEQDAYDEGWTAGYNGRQEINLSAMAPNLQAAYLAGEDNGQLAWQKDDETNWGMEDDW